MDRERVVRTLTFWLRPEFVLRVVSRVQKVAGFDRAIALASGALTATIPLRFCAAPGQLVAVDDAFGRLLASELGRHGAHDDRQFVLKDGPVMHRFINRHLGVPGRSVLGPAGMKT